MWSNSSVAVERLLEPTSKYKSSAYFIRALNTWTGCRSDASTMKEGGPITDPWISWHWLPPVLTMHPGDSWCGFSCWNNWPPNVILEVKRAHLLKQSLIPNRVESLCKIQREMITTKSFVSSIVVVCCRRSMTAAVVEPVGQKANWSLMFSTTGGFRKLLKLLELWL